MVIGFRVYREGSNFWVLGSRFVRFELGLKLAFDLGLSVVLFHEGLQEGREVSNNHFVLCM